MRWREKLVLVLVMIAWSYQQIVGEPQPAATPQIPWSRTFDPSHVKLHVKPEVNQGMFRASDTIVIQTTGRGPIRVFDLRGHVVFDGNNSGKLHLPTGHYFVETDGDRTQFAVLPNDYRGASFLGTDADFGDDFQYTKLVDRIAPSIVRLGYPTSWATVEPKPHEWDWAAADRAVDVNFSKGRKIIVVAHIRPPWLTNDADFLPHYLEYLRRMTGRYRRELFAIEVWNEPWITYDLWGRLPNPDTRNQPMTDWRQMVRSYTAVLQKARETIKKVNPKILVIGPDWINATSYYDITRRFLESGGQGLLDAFTYHDYDDGRFAPDVDTPWNGTHVNRLDKKIDIYRTILKQRDFRILVDEIGLLGHSALGCPNTGEPEYNSGLTWYRGMCRAIKYAVMYRAAGVEGLIPHVLAMGSGDPKRNLELWGWELYRRGPHPKTSAFLMACYWLNNARCTTFRTSSAQTFLSEWQRPDGKRFVIAWAREGIAPRLRLPTALQVSDIFGQRLEPNALNEEPLIFRWKTAPSKSSLLETVAAAIEE